MNIADSFYESFRGYGYFGVHSTVARVRVHGADKVFLTGDFCNWQEGIELWSLGDGIWQCEIPAGMIFEGCKYKYRVLTREGDEIFMSDPYAICNEERGAFASVFAEVDSYEWRDGTWLEYRKKYEGELSSKPLSIYRIIADRWISGLGGAHFSYRALARELAPYVKQLGFTHVQLASLLVDDGEYGSSSYFAARNLNGHPSELAAFVDAMHEAGVGVIFELPLYGHALGAEADYFADAFAFWLDRYHADGLCIGGVYTDSRLAEYIASGLKQKFPHAILVISSGEGFAEYRIYQERELSLCSADALVKKDSDDRSDHLSLMRKAFGHLMASPCKKLIDMGLEIGQCDAFANSDGVVWSLLDRYGHAELQRYVAELAQGYLSGT